MGYAVSLLQDAQVYYEAAADLEPDSTSLQVCIVTMQCALSGRVVTLPANPSRFDIDGVPSAVGLCAQAAGAPAWQGCFQGSQICSLQPLHVPPGLQCDPLPWAPSRPLPLAQAAVVHLVSPTAECTKVQEDDTLLHCRGTGAAPCWPMGMSRSSCCSSCLRGPSPPLLSRWQQ